MATPEQQKEKELEKHMADLETVNNDEDLEKKLTLMSKFGFSVASWMKILFNRDVENEEFKASWCTIDEYKSLAEQSLQNAWRISNLLHWNLEKRNAKGDIVESVNTQQFGKVYRFTGLVEIPSEFIYNEFKNNITKLPEWNPTLIKCEVIKEISSGIDLCYQIVAGGGGGIIASRDFVMLRRNAALDRSGSVVEEDPYCYMSSGVSVSVPGYPPTKHVRGNNKVGCWLLKPKKVTTSSGKIENHTIFQWLMCCDLKGKIPQFVLDKAFVTAMMDYIVHVRKFAAESKAKGLF